MPGARASRWSFAALAAFLLGGCSPADVINALEWRKGYEITKSVAYGDGARRTLDVYRPDNATAAPVIVFFYGGSWQTGEKNLFLFVAAALARRGYVIVVPDYRVYPEVRYPAFVEDGAQALRWVKDNAAQFGGDPNRLVVMGHSAGAYIAAMLTYDARWLNAVKLSPRTDIAGLVGIAGPYDFLPLRDETLKVIFGGANEPATQPISYVTPGAPPALLMAGLKDETVDPGNVTRLAAKLRQAGDPVVVKTYDNLSHVTILGAFASTLRFLAPVLDDTAAFVAQVTTAKRHAKRDTMEAAE